jgi:hypothetical protein
VTGEYSESLLERPERPSVNPKRVFRSGGYPMAYSSTTHTTSMEPHQPRRQRTTGESSATTAVPGRADLEAHLQTYHGFVFGAGLFVAHMAVILLLLYWFLM